MSRCFSWVDIFANFIYNIIVGRGNNMTYVKKLIKEAKDSGKTIDKEVIKGLKAVEKMHEITKECGGSPSKHLEEHQHPSRT